MQCCNDALPDGALQKLGKRVKMSVGVWTEQNLNLVVLKAQEYLIPFFSKTFACINTTNTWRSHDPHLKTVHQQVCDFSYAIPSLLLHVVSNLVSWLELYRKWGSETEQCDKTSGPAVPKAKLVSLISSILYCASLSPTLTYNLCRLQVTQYCVVNGCLPTMKLLAERLFHSMTVMVGCGRGEESLGNPCWRKSWA